MSNEPGGCFMCHDYYDVDATSTQLCELLPGYTALTVLLLFSPLWRWQSSTTAAALSSAWGIQLAACFLLHVLNGYSFTCVPPQS